MLGQGLNSADASYLDSPDLQNAFLSAAGLQGAKKESTPISNTVPGWGSSPPQLQATATASSPATAPLRKSFADAIKGSEGQSSADRSTNIPEDRQVSSSQWTRGPNDPQPLSVNYWDAQRVARGIANPSAYPRPRDQTAGNAGNELGGAVPTSSAPSRPSPNQTAWGAGNQQGGTAQTTSPPYRPSPHDRTPDARGRRDGAARRSPAKTRGRRNNRGRRQDHQQDHRQGHRQDNRQDNRDDNRQDHRQDQPRTPTRIAEIEPDLTSYRMPRPDKNYAGSTYSLPTLVSSINISDTGIGANGGQDAPDVRNTIGLRHNLRQAGDEWVQYNWDNPFGRDDNEALWESSYLGHFIKHWVAGIPDSPQVSFDQGGAEHWKCDIDTSRGVFLTPVLYPDSLVNHAEVDVTLEWRRQNWTSTLLMRRHNTNPRGNQRFGNNRRRNPRRDPEPELMDEDFIVEVQETPLERPEYNRYVPRIPCFLRPAEKFDMEAVRLIYNWEVEHGLQTLDSEPLSVEAFEKLLSTTQELGMPFIVAVRGSARDLGLTKGNLAFSVFKQIPFTEGKRGEILGFAFLSPWQPGLAGGLGSSRASAKLNVFVHPDYRRKKIGFSLLDMLLTTVSDCFSSQTGYDFIDPDDSPVYKNSPTRERQYFRLYISYMVKHQHRTDHKKLEAEQKKYDNDLVWVKKMLEDGLNFTELVRYKAAHRSSKAREGPVYWLDEVVFEHTCMFGPQGGRIKEDY